MAWRSGHVGDQKESVVAVCRNNPINENVRHAIILHHTPLLLFVTLWPCGVELGKRGDMQGSSRNTPRDLGMCWYR